VLKNMNAISSPCTRHDVLAVKADERLAAIRPVRDPKHHAKALMLHCSLRTLVLKRDVKLQLTN